MAQGRRQAYNGMNDCDIIARLWVDLNPHASIHGCEIDPAGSVQIYILYTRSDGRKKQTHPLELCLGNPAKAVIRSLRAAVRAKTRADRLTAVSGRQVIEDDATKHRKNEI